MTYLHWDEKTITDFSESNIADMYERGYVFTRIGKGVMQQTRSLRIDLSMFELSSENRRIIKKNEDVILEPLNIPYSNYDFNIGKLAKDFYDNKFGPNIMSAQKVKEMMTNSAKSNYNLLLKYSGSGTEHTSSTTDGQSGTSMPRPAFAISYQSSRLLHYSYPFYDLNAQKDLGLGMMIKAIEYAKEKGMKYIYLGSLQRPTDTYKLQFTGLEWFDGKEWTSDLEKVKAILS